jgi:hypothetical protein
MAEAGKQFRRVNGHMHLLLFDALLTSMSPPRLSVPSVMMSP